MEVAPEMSVAGPVAGLLVGQDAVEKLGRVPVVDARADIGDDLALFVIPVKSEGSPGRFELELIAQGHADRVQEVRIAGRNLLPQLDEGFDIAGLRMGPEG